MLNAKPINLLIVDDNQKNLFSLHTLIKEYLDVNIFEADCGAVALKIVMKQPVDLIILDVQMPNMDGFETAKAIRSRKKSQHIPIVFLTAAYKSEEFQQKGYAIGAADYLTKPIDASQLINRIQTYVRFIEQDRQYKRDLERKVKERTAELSKARYELEQRVEERTAELLLAKNKAEQAQKIAENANLTKSQFLANMSHELRTPLNAIIGYSEMLQEEAEELEPEDFIPDLQKIHAAGKHLLGLINDVLDISKIEAGKMGLFLETFDLATLLDEVVSSVQPLVEKKGNTLKIIRDDNLGNMHTDITKLRQMLLNLISNAAKFTEQGTIRLEVKRDDEWVNLCVADNGIGMTEEQQKKVFKPFTQADYSTTRRYGGTGLGLAITKQFVEIMGGTISVVSEFGQGSTFTLALPVQTKPADTKTTQPKIPVLLDMNGVVLIIDDDANIRQSLKNSLSKLGYAVAVATNGDEGLKLTKKLRPDGIFLNVQLSDREGWQVLSTLKNDSLLAHIPIIIITATEADKQKGYAMGATDCINKITVRRQLAAILEKHHIGDDSTGLVMVIEDDKIFFQHIASLLESQGWRVLPAENGQVALEQLTQKKPAVIILDLALPVMDGFEFLAHLLDNNKLHSTPVVVLTSIELSAGEQARLNKHVETIFQKDTYDQEELILRLRQLIANASTLKHNQAILTTDFLGRYQSVLKQVSKH
jgi:signal transduction histidine kinase